MVPVQGVGGCGCLCGMCGSVFMCKVITSSLGTGSTVTGGTDRAGGGTDRAGGGTNRAGGSTDRAGGGIAGNTSSTQAEDTPPAEVWGGDDDWEVWPA